MGIEWNDKQQNEDHEESFRFGGGVRSLTSIELLLGGVGLVVGGLVGWTLEGEHLIVMSDLWWGDYVSSVILNTSLLRGLHHTGSYE